MKGNEELARSIIPVSSDLSGFSRGTGTCYAWWQSGWVKELPVRGHLPFPKRLPAHMQRESGPDCKAGSLTSRVSWPRLSPDF